MRIKNYQRLARDFQLDGRKAMTEVSEALAEGYVKPEDFSIRALAENLVEDGREWVGLMDPRHGGGYQEAAGAVSTTTFANITGQIAYTRIMENFAQEAFTITNLIPTQQTSLDGEKIPGVTNIGDQAQIVNEGGSFPTAGVGENYIETPSTTKRGLIVPITKEAIFFDRTGLVLSNCAKVGDALGLNKEKRACDCLVDENTTAHRYKWRGNVIATYGDSSGTHSWDNLSASTGLLDYTDIDACEQLLANMTDPDTGEPIMVMADTIIVTPQNMATLRYILTATNVRVSVPGFATTGNPTQTDAPSVLGNHPFSLNYTPVTSRMLPARMATDSTWYIGNPRKAYVYMENWGLTVVQAPPNSEMEFTNDIVVRFKASERGAYATLEPRYMVKATA